MNISSLKATLDILPCPCLVLWPNSPHFTIEYANKAFCLVTNMPDCDLINKGMFEAFPENPADLETYGKERLIASLEIVIASKTSNRIEEQKYDIPVRGSENFEVRYWTVENSPVLNERGDVDFIIQIVTDITEMKILEKAVEVEIQRFQDLFSQAPSCMGILKGPNHIYELANPLYLKLIGKSDIIGQTVKEVLPELETQGIFEFLDTVYETGQSFAANEMLVQLDLHGTGELSDTYLNLIYQAHRNHDGSIDGIFFFAIDVTEQVLSRNQIELSEKRFKTLIQEGSDLISIVNENQLYTYLSPAFTNILGVKHEELIGTTPIGRIHEDDLERVTQTSARLEHEKHVKYTPFRYKVENGKYRWLESKATNLIDDPTINGILFNSNDITERMNHIEAIEEQNTKLKEIAWIQSHLVRAPVARILGLIELLKNEKEKDNEVELLNYIYDSTEELDVLIKDIIYKTEKLRTMTTINNVQPLDAEALFHILKSDFANNVNSKLSSSLSIEYAHVYDVINVYFPEIIEGTVFTITVNENEIELTNNGDKTEYNTDLLEQHLSEFLIERCS